MMVRFIGNKITRVQTSQQPLVLGAMAVVFVCVLSFGVMQGARQPSPQSGREKAPVQGPLQNAEKPDDGPVGEIANMSPIGSPHTVRFSPNGKFAVTSERSAAGFPAPLRLWDLQKRRQIASFAKGASHVIFTPDGRFVTYKYGGTFVLFDPITAKAIGKLSAKDAANSYCFDMSFSSDGKSFLTPFSHLGFVAVWDFATAEQRCEFKHGRKTLSACFATDEMFILSGGDDNAVRLWDIEKDRQKKTYEGHSRPVRFVRVFGDGTKFVSVSDDWKVIVWDLKRGKQMHSWNLDNMNPYPMIDNTPLAVASKGSRLLAGQKGGISFWDLNTGKKVARLEGHKNAMVTAVDITPDGRYALSAGLDRTVRYWRLPPLPVGGKRLPLIIPKKE